MRTPGAGRPVEMATLETEVDQLQRDLADLEKLLSQVERTWSLLEHEPPPLSEPISIEAL